MQLLNISLIQIHLAKALSLLQKAVDNLKPPVIKHSPPAAGCPRNTAESGNPIHYNTLSTPKCMVGHKKARFDTKMPGSTQKCPPQHASVDIAIIKHHPHPPVRSIFFQIYSNILFLRTIREMKMNLYWYEFMNSNIFNIIMEIEMKLFFSVCDDHNVCSYKYM